MWSSPAYTPQRKFKNLYSGFFDQRAADKMRLRREESDRMRARDEQADNSENSHAAQTKNMAIS